MILSIVLIRSQSGDDSFRARYATDFIAHDIIQELQGKAQCEKAVYWIEWGQYWKFLSIVFPWGLGSLFLFGGFGIITTVNVTPGYHVMSPT